MLNPLIRVFIRSGCWLLWLPLILWSQEVEITHLAGQVYLITGPGGNVAASIGPEGILLVDDKFERVSPEIKEKLASVQSGPIRFVLNTHWHHDHTEGNKVFGQEAIIVAHENVRKRLMEPARTDFGERPALPPHAWPIVTFEQSVNIYFNGEKIELRHYRNAHTDGDAIMIFTRSNVVHLGDLFFNGRFPYVDLGSGGNVQGVLKAVEEILPTVPRNARIIPGHGPVGSVRELRQYRDMLRESIERIKQARSAGQSLAAIQQSNPLQDFARWGEGFITTERWIELVYRSLEQ